MITVNTELWKMDEIEPVPTYLSVLDSAFPPETGWAAPTDGVGSMQRAGTLEFLGWLVAVNEDYYIMALGRGKNGDVAQRMMIPRSAVVEQREVHW